MSIVLLGRKTIIQRAIAVLRRFGTDAHVWLPGVGSVNGMTAGNYLLSDTSTGLTTQDDKVGRGRDAMGSLGADIAPNITNNIGWTLSGSWAVNGTVNCLLMASDITTYKNIGSIQGKSYSVTYSVTVTSGSFRATMNGAQGATRNTSGTYTEIITAVSTSGNFGFTSSSASTTVSITSVSVREVIGIDATQSTSGNMPVLRKGPVNLLLNSVLAGGSSVSAPPTSWSAVVATGVSAPILSSVFTGETAYSQTAIAQRPFFQQAFTFRANVTYIVSIYVESVSEVTNNDVLTVATGTGLTRTYYSNGNIVLNTAACVTGTLSCKIAVDGTDRSDSVRLGAGTTTVVTGSIVFLRPQLQLGSVATPYIPTTSKPLSSGVGPQYWEFGGDGLVTDYLTLSAVPFGMSDDAADNHTVVIAARCNSVTVTCRLFSSASNISTTPRVADIYINSAGQINANWVGNSGAQAIITNAADSRNTAVVISAQKVAANKILRVNGSAIGTPNTTALGSATTTATTIGVLPISSQTGYLNGNIYIVIAIKGTVSDADLLLLERLAASLAGVTLP